VVLAVLRQCVCVRSLVFPCMLVVQCTLARLCWSLLCVGLSAVPAVCSYVCASVCLCVCVSVCVSGTTQCNDESHTCSGTAGLVFGSAGVQRGSHARKGGSDQGDGVCLCVCVYVLCVCVCVV
jgi:hypothetical protein